MLDPKELVMSAPDTPSRRSSDIRSSGMNLQRLLTNMAEAVHDHSERKKLRRDDEEVSALGDEEVQRIIMEEEGRTLTTREN